MTEFATNQTKRVSMRMSNKHFEVAFGFRRTENKRSCGLKLIDYYTDMTTFSGIAGETTWNNTNVVGAALEFCLGKAGVKKF